MDLFALAKVGKGLVEVASQSPVSGKEARRIANLADSPPVIKAFSEYSNFSKDFMNTAFAIGNVNYFTMLQAYYVMNCEEVQIAKKPPNLESLDSKGLLKDYQQNHKMILKLLRDKQKYLQSAKKNKNQKEFNETMGYFDKTINALKNRNNEIQRKYKEAAKEINKRLAADNKAISDLEQNIQGLSQSSSLSERQRGLTESFHDSKNTGEALGGKEQSSPTENLNQYQQKMSSKDNTLAADKISFSNEKIQEITNKIKQNYPKCDVETIQNVIKLSSNDGHDLCRAGEYLAKENPKMNFRLESSNLEAALDTLKNSQKLNISYCSYVDEQGKKIEIKGIEAVKQFMQEQHILGEPGPTPRDQAKPGTSPTNTEDSKADIPTPNKPKS